MSSFICEHCGKNIIDTPTGYVTGCEHWPIEPKSKPRERIWADSYRRVQAAIDKTKKRVGGDEGNDGR